MELSCAFPAAVGHVEHAALAESLGYRRVWFYDSPALYEDVWMVLALAARETSRVGLGPAVLVPDLRHVLVTASAVATLEELAPGRAIVAIGTGVTGRMVLGPRPRLGPLRAAHVRHRPRPRRAAGRRAGPGRGGAGRGRRVSRHVRERARRHRRPAGRVSLANGDRGRRRGRAPSGDPREPPRVAHR